MSAKKRGLNEISQNRAHISGFAAATPRSRHYQTPETKTISRKQSTNVYGNIYANRPGSARNILRRLARATANTTQRRVATPKSAISEKENVAPFDSDEEVRDRLEKSIGFNIEESIEEDDSELPIAPTPSALLDASDEEDLEQPTVTFLDVSQARSAARRSFQQHPEEPSLLYSDPTLPAVGDEDQHYSTFLSEVGRRAMSEDPTRMSRYSFGSIRMSDFGSELEIRRESNRQQKLAELEAEDDYGGEIVNDYRLGGETELLKGLPTELDIIEIVGEEPEGDSFGIGFGQDDSLQPSYFADEEIELNAAQGTLTHNQPQLADTMVEPDTDPVDESLQPQNEAVESRRHTLLESMVTAAAEVRPRKRKLNQRGNLVPALPSSLMKRIVHDSQEKANKRKTTFGKDHIKALEQATEWFFEQASQDLDIYSSHGRRKKRIDANDMLLLMQRQRVLKGNGELFKMAKAWLPRDLLNELDLPDHL